MTFVLRSTIAATALLALLGSARPTALDVRVAHDRADKGRSGALQVRMLMPGQHLEVPLEWDQDRPRNAHYRWVGVLGTSQTTAATPLSGDVLPAPAEPGVYELEIAADGLTRRLSDARVLVKVPFNTKSSGRIGAYRIGSYPEGKSGRYAAPEGFIEVTESNQHLRVSDHFTLREFLTHDQQDVWPKYVIVSPKLLDKLELVLDALSMQGIPADRMVVMSGYRTPQYNERGVGSGGRAALSRHQYGDAADVWVDNNGDWYMDDLNRDGRRDTGDARVMLRAVETVEKQYPELLGGAGIYRDNGAHGPFLHIDTRGSAARW